MKVTFLLPTCEPETMFKFLLPSIHYLKPVKHLIEFNICFQPPYSKQEIKQTLKEFKRNHIKVNYMFKNYKVVKPYTPLIKMRNDCAMMSPNSDIYGLLDDDMSFESPLICNYIRNMLRYFKKESKLSVISFYNQDTVNYRENFYSTNAGLFYKGGKYFGFKGLVPEHLSDFNAKVYTNIPYEKENLLNLFGGHQDKFCAMIRLAARTYGKCMINAPVNHLENRLARGDKQHGWKDAEVLDGSIAHFIIKYFNKNFNNTHALTLFDNEENEKIYPYKYIDGKIKEEYDLYDERGILRDFFSKNSDKYYYGNPYVIKYKRATYGSKWHWKQKNYIARYKYWKDINLLQQLPKDIVEKLQELSAKGEIREKIITVFSIDYFGRNLFKAEKAKECYWSWNRSLSLPIRRLRYDFMLKVLDPRWENADLIEFKEKYKSDFKLLTNRQKEKLFILYILSKYPNHLYLDSSVFALDNSNFINEEIFDSNWLCIYNSDNTKFFKDLFMEYRTRPLSDIELNQRIAKFTNKLNFEVRK